MHGPGVLAMSAEAGPVVATVTSPGFALASCASSATVFAGTCEFTTSTSGARASSDTGTKSATAS